LLVVQAFRADVEERRLGAGGILTFRIGVWGNPWATGGEEDVVDGRGKLGVVEVEVGARRACRDTSLIRNSPTP